jgi:hypothetical protein
MWVPSTHLYITFGPPPFAVYSYFPGMGGVCICVRISTWSERPLRVAASYYTGYLAFVARIRSIQDRCVPLQNVFGAGVPGYIPFKMCQPHCSHVYMTHGALEFSCLSILLRGIVISSIVGDNSPILAFQSPHMTALVCLRMWLRVSSI